MRRRLWLVLLGAAMLLSGAVQTPTAGSSGTAPPAHALAEGQEGLARAGVPWLWAQPHPIRNVLVAVIDSGVAPHPALAGRVAEQVTLVGGEGDEAGHGTAVASIIAGRSDSSTPGVCRACTVLPIRITGTSDRADSADAALAVRRAVEAGAEVINLSLAGDRRDVELAAAISDAVAAGAVVVAAAGNDGRERPQWPAALPDVVSVSHLGSTNSLAYGGTRGADLATRTCLPAAEAGDEATAGSTRTMCGSSIAAAVVSGVVAEMTSQGHTDPVGALRGAAAPHPDAAGRLDVSNLAPW